MPLNWRRALLLLLPLLLAVGCASRPAWLGGPRVAPGDERVVGKVGDEPITLGALRDWIREDLYVRALAGKDPGEAYDFHANALERMIDERLVVAEAKRRNLSGPELYAAETRDAGQVSDEQVKAWWDQHGAQLQGATYETAAPEIRATMAEKNTKERWQTYVLSLREQAIVTIEMEPPRYAVEAIGPMRGADAAPVTIVEFADFECPFCRRATPAISELLARYEGRVRVFYRHYPLKFHAEARPAAEAAVCADEQQQFWGMHDQLMAAKTQLTPELIDETAKSLAGMDLERFHSCLSEGRAKATVERDMQAGNALGVSGTPAFFVNGILLSGALPIDAFAKVIDAELARAKSAKKTDASVSMR
jgi:protein-disulfide isomerase